MLEALDGGSTMALKLWGRKSSLIPPDENTVTRVQCAAVTIWRGGRELESTVLTSFGVCDIFIFHCIAIFCNRYIFFFQYLNTKVELIVYFVAVYRINSSPSHCVVKAPCVLFEFFTSCSAVAAMFQLAQNVIKY